MTRLTATARRALEKLHYLFDPLNATFVGWQWFL